MNMNINGQRNVFWRDLENFMNKQCMAPRDRPQFFEWLVEWVKKQQKPAPDTWWFP